MKTEISRDSYQPDKRYTGVYQQQGRMLTDADWNELVEIIKSRLSESLQDVVGIKAGSLGGTPRHRGLTVKFEIDSETLTEYLAIEPGYIYIDGIGGRIPETTTLAFTNQQDLPSVPGPSGNYILYADLWERTVTHLMDQWLRDKGLHGADTCTRKKMMVQVKWCGTGTDPEDEEQNPRKGNATLDVTLQQKTTQPDSCDPCADAVDVETNVGNYLFRVEVHDVEGVSNAPSKLTLKWSAENGAELYALPDGVDTVLPDTFISDNFVYEFFTEDSEKHLGINFAAASGFPMRGELYDGFPLAIPSGYDFVRRWDGFAALDLGAGTITGVDKGVPLSIDGTLASLGSAFLDADFQVILELLKLKLSITGKHFVAGDFWLAPVREAEHTTGSSIVSDKLPDGIEHRYLILGTVSADSMDDNPETDRKYAFPSLTEMTRLFSAGGDGQEVMPGDALPQPLRVGVANGEWPVVGATVRFQIEAGEGELTPVNGGITDANGIAECVWKPASVIHVDYRVKASLVDPENDTDPSKDFKPAVYFYANLITADQVAYEPGCPDAGENSVHTYLATDTPPILTLGPDSYYTVKEVLDALLCKLHAKHIPYDITPSNSSRWADVNLEELASNPLNVQDAIDALLKNLHSEDISYLLPTCDTTAYGYDTLKKRLESEILARHDPADLPNRYRINELWNVLLCNLDAAKIPYNATLKGGRWDDVNLEESDPRPETVQEALDALVDNLQSEDIKYKPDCPDEIVPSVRLALGISDSTYSRVHEIFNKLLCNFNATHLPLSKSDIECDALNQFGINSVQDALNALCKMQKKCVVTVGEKGGDYATLEDAFNSDELTKSLDITICLLTGPQHIVDKLDVADKYSITIHGPGTVVFVQRHMILSATKINLDGIHFSFIDDGQTGKGTGFMSLTSPTGGTVSVEHCYFFRTFNHANPWQPLVRIGSMTNLYWQENHVVAIDQDPKVRAAIELKPDVIDAASLATFEALKLLWDSNPYNDPENYRIQAGEVATRISKLNSANRTSWFNARPITEIETLPIETKPISIPRIGDRLIAPRTLNATPTVSLALAREVVITDVSPRAEVANFYELVNKADANSVSAITDAIINVAALVNTTDYALVLEPRVSGWISNNSIYGYIGLLAVKEKDMRNLTWASTKSPERQNNKNVWIKDTQGRFLESSGELNLLNNSVSAIYSAIPVETLLTIEEILDKGVFPPDLKITAYTSITLRDNLFAENNSSLISRFANISGNQFPNAGGDTIVLFALAYSGIICGQQALNRNSVIEQIISQIEAAANLITIV